MARIDDPAYLRHDPVLHVRQSPGSHRLPCPLQDESSGLAALGVRSAPPARGGAGPARVLEIGCGAGSLWLENRSRIPAGWEITLSDLSAGMLDQARRNLDNSQLAALDAQASKVALSPERKAAFARFAGEEMARLGGVLRVSKDYGLFEETRAR